MTVLIHDIAKKIKTHYMLKASEVCIIDPIGILLTPVTTLMSPVAIVLYVRY